MPKEDTAEGTLSAILDASARLLLQRILSGDATAADLNVARQLLKDNGISCIATGKNPLGQLGAKVINDLPFKQSAQDVADEMDNLH
jgi:hypothetical protein